MNDEVNSYIKTIYMLKTLVRYNNTPRIVDESVAEHQYFVAMIVYKLYSYYNFNLSVAIKMALFHDVPEIFLSDMPNNTKSLFPEIAKSVRKSQKKACEMVDKSMSPLVEEYEDQASVESKIVKLADILSIVQYTRQESLLGNEFMDHILNTAVKISEGLYSDLEGVRKK